MQKIFTDFCKHNRYVTTLHVINSALIKLSKLLSVVKVYRGVERGMLPECFWEANDFNVRGGVEFAFMSTTTERDVAIFYSGAEKDGNVSTIIEGQLGMVDRGADLSSLSQYPHEKEICFGPLTSLEVLSTRVEKSYLVVHCRFNINLVSLTIEQVLAKRHRIVTDVCDNVMQHTRKVIAAFSSNPSEGAETKSAIEYACTKLEGITARRPDIFNDDGELKGAVTKALDMKGLFDEWLQATMCHNVPDIDDRGDPDVTWSSFATKTVEHYHTLIPSDLSHITLSCQWRDEGSGTFHGRINLVVTRNGEIVSEVPCFGRAPHDWQTERAVFSAEELHGHLPGDVLTLQYELGESHYRKLMVKDIELVMDRNPINASRRAVSQQEAARSETFGFREARKGSKEQVLADGMRRNALAERAHLVEELVQSQTGDAQALPALLGLTPSPLEVLAAAGRASGGNLLHLVCKLRRVDVFKCLLGIADGVWTEMAKERDGEGALPDLPGLARAVAASRPFDARAAGPLLSLLPSSCAGSFFQERDEVGNAPLHAAAVSGRVGDVLALARAHLPQAELRGLFLARNSQGHPPMHCAAEAGRPEAVRGLAEALEPDELAAALAVTAGHRERTPLHLAASNGHAETVRVLAGLAPDLPTALALPDSVGRTALHLAAGSGDAEAVRALAGLAPDLPAALAARSQSGKTPLHAAADWGEVDAILALVQLAPDVPTVLAARTSDGSAPLHLAAKSGRVDAVRALVDWRPTCPPRSPRGTARG
ncbi:unnamed protein product [Prorocentrum cordatum]|uniref:Mono(ADP-ribosyl)transferase n=1 Tax=Prorocentrum cordatum TaxID=2364126 RepID=A0ABN9T0Q5_9DINO|nr:unnamed protein product [Polarella glacialis]